MRTQLVKPIANTICGKETLSVLDSAESSLTLPASEPDPSQIQYAVISVSDGDIRYWETGDTPTTTAGILITAPGVFDVVGNLSITQLEMICTSGTANVNVQYYKSSLQAIKS